MNSNVIDLFQLFAVIILIDAQIVPSLASESLFTGHGQLIGWSFWFLGPYDLTLVISSSFLGYW